MDRYDRPHTLFYLDPPYWQTEGYGVPFGYEQYQDMAERMRACQGKVIVSINDHPDIRAVFEGLNVQTVDIRYTVGGGGQSDVVRELVVTNFDPVGAGGLFG